MKSYCVDACVLRWAFQGMNAQRRNEPLETRWLQSLEILTRGPTQGGQPHVRIIPMPAAVEFLSAYSTGQVALEDGFKALHDLGLLKPLDARAAFWAVQYHAEAMAEAKRTGQQRGDLKFDSLIVAIAKSSQARYFVTGDGAAGRLAEANGLEVLNVCGPLDLDDPEVMGPEVEEVAADAEDD